VNQKVCGFQISHRRAEAWDELWGRLGRGGWAGPGTGNRHLPVGATAQRIYLFMLTKSNSNAGSGNGAASGVWRWAMGMGGPGQDKLQCS